MRRRHHQLYGQQLAALSDRFSYFEHTDIERAMAVCAPGRHQASALHYHLCAERGPLLTASDVSLIISSLKKNAVTQIVRATATKITKIQLHLQCHLRHPQWPGSLKATAAGETATATTMTKAIFLRPATHAWTHHGSICASAQIHVHHHPSASTQSEMTTTE